MKKTDKRRWQVSGCAPIIVYQDYLLAVAEDYQHIQAISLTSGTVTVAAPLPDFLPRDENAMATVTTAQGDFILLSVPNQSRLLAFKIEK